MWRIIFFLFITLSSRSAVAQYSLYEGDIGQLSVGAEFQTALFGNINNQSGGSAKANLSDSFWELTAKPRIEGELNAMEHSKLYGGFSYVYSSTLNHDLSGYTQKEVPMYQQESDFMTLATYDNYRYSNETEALFLGWKSYALFSEDDISIVYLSGGR